VRCVLIRHGETAYNHEGRFQAHVDIPLNETGRAQARAVGQRLDGRWWNLVASSDLTRSVETADLIAQQIRAPRITLPALRERDLGELDGLETKEYALRHPEDMRRLQTEYDYAPPGGETATAALDRFCRGLSSIAEGRRHSAGADKAVLVVAHGAVLKFFGARFLRRDPADVELPGNCRGVAAVLGRQPATGGGWADVRGWDVAPHNCERSWGE
jgi:probable phosphoglycerate mutase